MHLTAEEVSRLRKEAQWTYEEYGRVRAMHRADRSNPEVRRKMLKLRARYEELGRLLNGQAGNGGSYARVEALLDISQLEPDAPQALKPGNYIALEPEEPWLPRLLRYATRARLAISIVMLVAAFGTLALIGNQNLGFYVVPTSSMEPTLMPNDRLVAYSSSEYGRGDVVVFRDPDAPDGYLVKRIVGLPGDTVAVQGNRLVVNGTVIQEPYLKERIDYHLGPTYIGAGEVFLLGDNRNFSHDGHIWKRGVPKESIMGAVRYIYAPRERRGARVAYPEVFKGVK